MLTLKSAFSLAYDFFRFVFRPREALISVLISTPEEAEEQIINILLLIYYIIK